jgi:CheY-like chemotaxis protein
MVPWRHRLLQYDRALAQIAMNVLIIDDSEISRGVMTHALETHGCLVTSLASPIGVTRVVVREHIDVVVIDVNLPSISGDRLASMFRKGSRMGNVGVVLVSGIERSELERLGAQSQADAVVHKEDLIMQLPMAVMRAFGARK